MFDRPINHSIYLLAKVVEVLNLAVFKLVNWQDRGFEDDPHSHGISLDTVENPDDTQITLREIETGDLQVECPHCGDMDSLFLVGLGTSQLDDEDNEQETFDLVTVGVLGYPCGCMIYSKCLTDKVVNILNASDSGALTIDMIYNLNTCQEHGVLHTEE